MVKIILKPTQIILIISKKLMTHLQDSQSKLDLLLGANADDNDLQLLAGYILNG